MALLFYNSQKLISAEFYDFNKFIFQVVKHKNQILVHMYKNLGQIFITNRILQLYVLSIYNIQPLLYLN